MLLGCDWTDRRHEGLGPLFFNMEFPPSWVQVCVGCVFCGCVCVCVCVCVFLSVCACARLGMVSVSEGGVGGETGRGATAQPACQSGQFANVPSKWRSRLVSKQNKGRVSRFDAVKKPGQRRRRW